MFFRKVRNPDAFYHKFTELMELCMAAEKRLISMEDRLIHVEERLEHVEERLKIVDEDKIEDMRSRLIHIEDKVNAVMNQDTGDIYVSFEQE